VGGQKPESAKVKYEENARKHKPRRMLKGGAGLSAGERKGRAAGQVVNAKERLRVAREAAEKRELERDAAVFVARIKGSRNGERGTRNGERS